MRVVVGEAAGKTYTTYPKASNRQMKRTVRQECFVCIESSPFCMLEETRWDFEVNMWIYVCLCRAMINVYRLEEQGQSR